MNKENETILDKFDFLDENEMQLETIPDKFDILDENKMRLETILDKFDWDDAKKVQFEVILERYNLPKNAYWKGVLNFVDNARYSKPVPAKGEGLMCMDAEELIRLINLIKGEADELMAVTTKDIEVKTDGISVKLKDKILKKYLLLSLHKLLQLKWGMDKTNEDVLKEGGFSIWAKGAEDVVKVEIKRALAGEDRCFIQPFSDDELESLLRLEMKRKQCDKVRAGRSGKNVAFLGDLVRDALAAIPDELKDGLSKTDLLNFVGEVMALAGYLDNVPNWKKLSDELERWKKAGANVYQIRARRAQMLKNWLAQARKVYAQVDDFGFCAKDADLEFYKL